MPDAATRPLGAATVSGGYLTRKVVLESPSWYSAGRFLLGFHR